MSMLDSFFKQRFNAAKCKTLLKLTIPRIKLLRNRREIQIKQMRKDIAKLLETGQEATARIRVEHIIREEKMMAAQEIVELFCELIAVRLPIIEAQRECPLDLKEAISSVCFAAPRCADLPELLHVQMLFAGKYGKEFVSAATELMPECGVNRQLVELLSVRAPSPDVKLKLLKEIAEEYELDWDPSTSESELLKPHEDLLNGSTQFVSLSLPEMKNHENTRSEPPTTNENTDSSGIDSDILDFPEVPKQLIIQQPNKVVTSSAPEMLHFPASALSDVDDDQEQEEEKAYPCGGNNNTSHLETEDDVVVAKEDDASSRISQDKQFLPFTSPPASESSPSFPVKEHESPPSISNTNNIDDDNNNNNDSNVDLQDVLAAALAAAESAERAASAARSAATIAQLRISELFSKNNDQVRNQLDKQLSIGDSDNASSSTSPSQSHPTPLAVDPNVLEPTTTVHQPQRLPSMDDETYFSYPNLFTSQGSSLSTHQNSFTDSK